jgi:hypothetical protein
MLSESAGRQISHRTAVAESEPLLAILPGRTVTSCHEYRRSGLMPCGKVARTDGLKSDRAAVQTGEF